MNNTKRFQIMDSLHSMLNTIGQISKKTQNFNQLQQLLPLLVELRKSDIDNKEIAQYLKLLTDLLPKLKTKVLLSNRGDSIFEVYDRMTNHLNLELNKLNAELEDVHNSTKRVDLQSEEQIKVQTGLIVKEIEDMLVANKKVVANHIASKRKQYFCTDGQHYMNKKLVQKIKSKNKLKLNMESCKYEFGQFRCLYNVYQVQNRSKQVMADVQKLEIGKETGMSEQMMIKLQKKIELQNRKQFLLKSISHVQKEYPVVIRNLKKFDTLNNPGNYEQKLFYHYFSWGKRLRIMIQTILIKLSNYQRNKLNIKQEQQFLEHSRQVQQKCHKLLMGLLNALK